MNEKNLIVCGQIETPLIVLQAHVLERAGGLCREADSAVVTDAFEQVHADQLYLGIRTLESEIEKQRVTVKDPVLKLGKAIDEAVRPIMIMLAETRVKLGDRILAFKRIQEQLAREAEERRRKELEAIEAERKAKELARIAQEAALKEKGMPIPPPPPVAVVAPPRPLPAPVPVIKSASVTTMKQKVLVIDDKRQIPWEIGNVELLTPNEISIKRLLMAGITVPGCRLEEREVQRAK